MIVVCVCVCVCVFVRACVRVCVAQSMFDTVYNSRESIIDV